MAKQRRRLACDSPLLTEGFARIRAELKVPTTFPDPVLAEAEAAAGRGPNLHPSTTVTEVVDRRDIPFISIDPPGSRDIDQIYAAERRGDGYRVFYGIADLAAFVDPYGAINAEALERGVTLYSPDGRASLHPDVLNEGETSLLPGVDRQSLLWTIDLDSSGAIVNSHVERAQVRNLAAMTYREAQAKLDDGSASDALTLLPTIGKLRIEQEQERGAVSLNLASQEVVLRNDCYELEYDETLPIESWNAQISLLTGIAAASIMLDGGVGLLRTLPPPWNKTIRELRLTAKALGVDWADGVSYADRIRQLDPNVPAEAAMMSRSARVLRGAGYVAFADGETPEQPLHSAIASTYAHVTAPLRRVCDRFTNEVLLSLAADRGIPEWAAVALPTIPKVMGKSSSKDRALDRAIVDFMEAVLLSTLHRDTFDAVVTSAEDGRATLQLVDPAVIARIDDASLEAGTTCTVRLLHADPLERRLDFAVVR